MLLGMIGKSRVGRAGDGKATTKRSIGMGRVPCEKIESKRGEFKREIKCKDGMGAQWHGEWKKEYRNGPCKVKLEAKYDEFKEEVRCE